ncbi:pilus assembly protein [Hydrogenivirga sp.]
MRNFFRTLLGCLALLYSGFVYSAATCNVPPFLTTAVPPNILFVIDVSGSMDWSAYNPRIDGVGFCDGSETCRGTYTGDEEGYFIPDHVYSYNSSAGYWEEATGTPATCPQRYDQIDYDQLYMGSCLNFHFMSRIDLLRWAVTGGRPQECDYGDPFNTTDCDPDLVCTGTTCVLETTTTWERVLVPKDRVKGILQIMENEPAKPRFGALFYSAGLREEKVYIGDYPYTGTGNPGNADATYPYTYLKRFINRVEPYGGTGTAIALWEAYDYFKQSNDHNYANGFDIAGTNEEYKDPIYVCDYQGKNCQIAPCAKNFIILASDGQWNYGGNPADWRCSVNSAGYENYSVDPVVPAYRIHTDTLRTVSALGDSYDINVSGVYSLGMFLGGTGERSLQNVAIYGSFDTAVGAWPGGTSGSLWNGSGAHYPWQTCTMDDCGSGRGSGCTPLPSDPDDDGVIDATYSDWDKDGDGLPDTFLKAENAIQIKQSLLAFIRDILKKTSSASSVSILSRRGTKGNSVIQAVFYPEKPFPGGYKANWIGYLYNYWFYYTSSAQEIREDTVEDKVLNLDEDYILDFDVDTSGNLIIYGDDPTTTSTSPDITYNSLDEVHDVWEAGEVLKNKDSADRNIYVVGEDTSGNDVMVTFTITDKSKFQSFMGDTASFPGCLTSVDDLINFIRGQHISGCRDRRVDSSGSVWKLGDIVYSTPAIVDYGDYGMVYVGANDGMLHAFRVGALRTDGLSTNDVVKLCDELTGSCTTLKIGDEEWAFIPKNALPYLKYLADPDYDHRYIVDMQPYIMRIDKDGDGIPETAILIGGMRLGGGCGCSGSCTTTPSSSCCINPPSDTCSDPSDPSTCTGYSSYFALDITDPQNPVFLWEFSHPDLGFTYSGPAHIKVNGKHFIMFVSGPTSLCGDAAQDLRLFILEMDNSFKIANKYIIADNSTTVSYVTGYTVVEDSTLSSFNNSFGGRLFTEGIDYDGDGNTDMVFFGVNKLSGSTWQGNILGVKITGDNPADTTDPWDVIKVFNSSIEPITSKVEYMKCFGMNYIFFGTGRWFYKDDEPGQNVNDKEKLYGVRIDDCLTGGSCNINAAKSSNESCTELTGGTGLFSWYRELSPKDSEYSKERLISDPAVTNYDVIFFATTQPTGNICGFGGRSRLWGLNCATGQGLLDTSCPSYIANVPDSTAVLLQLSRGNIEVIGKSDFTEESESATDWYKGTTPEAPPTLPGGGGASGKIILWIER